MSDVPRHQRTLASPVAVEGFGYWSGQDVRVEFRPVAQDVGIVFVRDDLNPAISIPATIENQVETPRRTTLVRGNAQVEMIEHVMAALAGLHVDNCEVWVNAAEMPGCDGSAQAFVDAIDHAGIVALAETRRRFVVRRVIRLGDEDSWIEARPATDPTMGCGMSVDFRLDYGSDTAIGRQRITLSVTPQSFREELATSRTFMLKHEADELIEQGLGTRVTSRDLLVFDADGPIDNPLRFENECVRHKALDLVGDLALGGCDWVGHVVAHRSGHRLNADLVRALLADQDVEQVWRRSA